MKPQVIIVGADKGGVGKTTVSRALLDYYTVNHKQGSTRAFDTDASETSPDGVLRRFFKDQTSLVDLTTSDGQMQVFDTLRTTPITIIDIRAGLMSQTLQTLTDIGFMDKAQRSELGITALHVLGGSMASFKEIQGTADKLAHATHYLVRNHINDNSFFKWNDDMRVHLTGGVIDIAKMNELASEHVDAAGQSFEAFCADTSEKTSDVLKGYVRHWLNQVYPEFDKLKLNTL